MLSKLLHSVYEPFFLRGDKRAADLIETENLYAKVKRRHDASPYVDEEKGKEFRLNLFYRFEERIPLGLRADFYNPFYELLSLERAIFELPEFHPSLTLKQMVELRDELRRKEHFYANEGRIIELVTEGLTLIFGEIADDLPETLDPSPFVIPLVYTLPEPQKLITRLMGTLWQDRYVDACFIELCRTLHFNLCRISGIADPHNPTGKTFLLPIENKAPLSEIVDGYLGGTPFRDLFTLPVPLKLTHEDRFQHCHIVGGSGAGKTQLLQSLILHDLQCDDPPALVVVDSQGDLIDKIAHLKGIEDRIVLVTPKDIDHPPALNIFDLDRGRMRDYDPLTKEQVTAGAIETFDYLFTGLLGADLTAKQGVFFRYVARLMLSLPETTGQNATILDMIRLMDDIEPYREAIERLPEIQRQFFMRDFTADTFKQTKEQIRYRLQGIIENPTIAKLFTSPNTKVDIFTELNNGKVILVDTAKDLLKGSSSHFGRIFIALVLQAALERAAIPEEERRSAFLVVDECAEYFDQNIDDMLTQVRKYKLGCCFAHQHLDQCTPQLRASFAANTGIKMVSGVSSSDARALAPDMRTTPDFILSQPRLHFACHIRGVTPQAVSIPVKAGKLEREPKLSVDQYETMRGKNRDRVSLGPGREPPSSTPDFRPDRPLPTNGGVPFMITQAQKEALRARGYTDAQIRDMKPEEAHRILEGPARPPRSQRTRPKKPPSRKPPGPLTGDIDTSA